MEGNGKIIVVRGHSLIGTSPQLAPLIRCPNERKYSRTNSPSLGYCALCQSN